MRYGLKKFLKHKFPVVQSLKNYSAANAASDFFAGITVGLMLIPQSIAYSPLAGLHPQYGLYSALAGGFIYAIFGTIKQVSIGPTTILALLSYQYAHDNPDIAALLSFITGCTCIIFGIFNLGFVINFVSTPVVSGYTSAAAVVIASSQIKGLLGLNFSSTNFLSTVYQVVKHISSTKLYDAILGITCVTGLILLKEISSLAKFKHLKLLFYASIGKNFLVVFISSSLAYIFERFGITPFTLTGKFEGGLPMISLPDFSPVYEGVQYSFLDVLHKMGFGITALILIAIISQIVVAKVFIKSDRMDASQEIIALGAINCLGSFLGAMPVSGSFSRSAVNNSCGVKTPLAGIYSALLVLFSLLFLTPCFYYIPKAALSAIIVTAMIYMMEFKVFLRIWKINRKDIIPSFGTFLSALCFGIEFGLICGLLIDMIFLLYFNTNSNTAIDKFERGQVEYILLTPRNGLLFPSANCLQETILSEIALINSRENKKIVLNLENITNIDYTSIQMLINLKRDSESNNCDFIIININEKIETKLSELSHIIYTKKSFESLDNNVSTFVM